MLAAVDDSARLRNPHFRARGSIVDVPDGAGGMLTTAAPLPQRVQDPGRIQSAGGELGADNAAVFGEWLGFSAEQLDAWRSDGVI